MTTQLFSNNAISLLSAGISETATSLSVIPGHGALFPQPTGDGSDYFLITLEDQSASVREIIRVTKRIGDVLYFDLSDRGQEGTAVLAWSAVSGNDTIVDHRITAETMRLAMTLPAQSAGASWIFGENTVNTNIDQGWQLPISVCRYSNQNRAFKYIVTVMNTVTFSTRTFEVLLVISGNVSAGTEVVNATKYGMVGPSIQGEVHASINPSTKILELAWQNDEAMPVVVHVTRVQHFQLT
jgi:hypothetical protein